MGIRIKKKLQGMLRSLILSEKERRRKRENTRFVFLKDRSSYSVEDSRGVRAGGCCRSLEGREWWAGLGW